MKLDRLAISGWVSKLTALLEPQYSVTGRHVQRGQVVFAGDTLVKMLPPGTGRIKTVRFWAYVRDELPWLGDAQPADRYQFRNDRKGIRTIDYLKNYSGWMHADGYAGFEKLYKTGRIREVACMAHGQRKFVDV